jgi:anti-anti-sigma factor
LRIGGELDIAGAAALEAVLRRTRSIRKVDLGDVTFIDAAGLRILRDALRCSAPGAVIRNPSPCVVRLIALVGLDATLAAAGATRPTTSLRASPLGSGG